MRSSIVMYLEVPSPKAEFVLVVLAKYLAGKFVVELILSKNKLKHRLLFSCVHEGVGHGCKNGHGGT